MARPTAIKPVRATREPAPLGLVGEGSSVMEGISAVGSSTVVSSVTEGRVVVGSTTVGPGVVVELWEMVQELVGEVEVVLSVTTIDDDDDEGV